MADAVYVLIIVGFFALAALYVKACEAIIGPDQSVAADFGDTEREQLAA